MTTAIFKLQKKSTIMSRSVKTVLFLNIFIFDFIFAAPSVSFIPIKSKSEDPEKKLNHFLGEFYENFINTNSAKNSNNEHLEKYTEKLAKNDDIYDTMQGDQPVAENSINQNTQQISKNFTYQADTIMADPAYVKAKQINIAKEQWIAVIKEKILKQVGRLNTTIPEGTIDSNLNFDSIQHFLNSTDGTIDDDQIMEQIRGFYPSCDMPLNTDQDLWKNDDMMNLFFTFDYDPEDSKIATATLRLYRIPENNTQFNSKKSQDCVDPPATEEEKLIRVSVYWYTKSLKKRRNGGVKRRLADSKVVLESAKYVELNVKPATKAWLKGKNLGLGIMVDDQEGNILRADKYFEGASCMVGTSTPKPIPTIILDAAEYNQNISFLGRNSTPSVYSDKRLPTLDICTLRFPDNYSLPEHLMNLRINACNLKTLYDQKQKQMERERLERMTTLSEYLRPNSRHIRHQRQHMANKINEEERANRNNFDIRSRMVNSRVIIRNDELRNLAAKYNLTIPNR